jgi:hypothetical protein
LAGFSPTRTRNALLQLFVSEKYQSPVAAPLRVVNLNLFGWYALIALHTI